MTNGNLAEGRKVLWQMMSVEGELRRILDGMDAAATENDGVVPDDAMERMIEKVERRNELAKSAVGLIRTCEAIEGALKTEKERLEKRMRSVRRLRDAVKEMVIRVTEKEGVETKSGGRRWNPSPDLTVLVTNTASVEIEDPDAIPDELVEVVVERRPKKREILSAWRDTGVAIPGTSIKVRPSLRIR